MDMAVEMQLSAHRIERQFSKEREINLIMLCNFREIMKCQGTSNLFI